MILNLEHLPRVIPVGIQTESGVETIGFDLSPWVTRWPGMTFAVWPTRPGESASYIAADTELVGNVLYWYPNAADTEKEGAGTVEVVGIGGGKCKSSGVIDTLVKKTSLDVTQETPEPFKPWFDSVLQAANEVKASVDAGEGTLYLIQQKGSTTDRTYDEINAAINAKKTCILTDTLGRVHLYSNRNSDGTLIFRAIEHGVPIGGGAYTSLTEREVHIDKDGKTNNIAISPVKTPTPNKLTIEQNGETVVFDGRENVNIKIEGVPDPGKAHQQLVSDADGKAVWQDALAYKYVKSGVMDILKEETLFSLGDDDGDGTVDMFASVTPLAEMPEVGKTYEVTINGTQYNSRAYDVGDAAPGIVIGNPNKVESSLEDTGEPYAFCALSPEAQAVMGGATLVLVYSADSVTLSIRGDVTVTSIKKIDKDLLPDTNKTITIMIDADGNVMCDTLFAEAWAMTTGELQGAIVVKESSAYKGTTYTTADTVAKVENEVMGNFIEIRLRQGWIDTADFADKDNVRYLMWRIDNQIVIDDKQLNALPIMTKSDALKGGYLRYNGKSWEYATIDQLKADIGHVTVRASQDGTLAISGIDKSFNEVLSALKAGAHVQLMLTRPDGFTEVYPAVGYADTQIMFILLPSHDASWAVEWTESGMTKILSGND